MRAWPPAFERLHAALRLRRADHLEPDVAGHDRTPSDHRREVLALSLSAAIVLFHESASSTRVVQRSLGRSRSNLGGIASTSTA